MREQLKKISFFKYLVIVWRTFAPLHGPVRKLNALSSFFREYRLFRKLQKNTAYQLETEDLFPRIYDKTGTTKIDPVYYLQGVWCAQKIFESKPTRHYDIGSQAQMVGIISQFVPTTMVDIRPLSVSLPELSFVKGNITALPFENNSIRSLSSICVIEHIGLGRYGDPLDQFGTEKAAAELSRVLAPGGSLYISVPVDRQNKVYFNAHRAFTRDYVLGIFKDLTLAEESYIYGSEVLTSHDANKGFGTGLYHFKK